MKHFKWIAKKIFPSQPVRIQIKRSLAELVRSSSFARRLGLNVARGYLPLGAKLAQQQFANYAQVKLQTIVEENASATPPAHHLPQHQLAAIQPFTLKTETVLLDITDSRFSFRNNHLIDDQINVLEEWNHTFEGLPVHIQFLERPIRLQGTVAYLSNISPENYYHWMCRTLPLLRFYQRCLDEIDYFYVGKPLAGGSLRSFQIASLEKAGIPTHKIIENACTADRLLAAISNRCDFFGSDAVSAEHYNFVRSFFLPQLEAKSLSRNRRIYVKRGNVQRRRVCNEAAVIELLQQYGFETVVMDNLTLQQQAELFYSAEAIVAPHGAALTNLLFIQPETKVVEIFPNGYINSCFYVLASYGNAHYFYIQSETTGQAVDDVHDLDIVVNPDELEQICQAAQLHRASGQGSTATDCASSFINSFSKPAFHYSGGFEL